MNEKRNIEQFTKVQKNKIQKQLEVFDQRAVDIRAELSATRTIPSKDLVDIIAEAQKQQKKMNNLADSQALVLQVASACGLSYLDLEFVCLELDLSSDSTTWEKKVIQPIFDRLKEYVSNKTENDMYEYYSPITGRLLKLIVDYGLTKDEFIQFQFSCYTMASFEIILSSIWIRIRKGEFLN